MREEGWEHTYIIILLGFLRSTSTCIAPSPQQAQERKAQREGRCGRETHLGGSFLTSLFGTSRGHQLTFLKQSKKSAQLVFLFFIERALARRKVQPLSDWRGAISRQRIYRDTVHWAAIVYCHCRILYGELNAIDSRPHWQQLFPPPARPRGHLRALPARQKQQQPVAVSIFDAVLDAVPPFFWRLLVPSAEHPRRPPSIPPA